MRPLVSVACCSLLLAPTASAQTLLHTFDEPEAAAGAGHAVAIWDDVNSDGYNEWVVGARAQDSSAVDAGRVTVLSGLDNSVLFTFDGTNAGDEYGSALANLGDLNVDGFDELAVGSRGANTVFVLSGIDNSVMHTLVQPTQAFFGESVAAAGDVDGDGTPDIVVGAPRAGSFAGRVWVYSGATGNELFNYAGPYRLLGFSVSAAGDTNGDGFDDVLVGAPYTNSADQGIQGAAVILGGPTGNVLFSHTFPDIEKRGMEFGYSTALIDDIDGDGVRDYAIGARWYGWLHYIDDAFVAIYSGATHTEIRRFTGGSDGWFGYSMANAGDLDADGFDDILVGDALFARVHAFSPARDVELFVHQGTFGTFVGTSVAGGSDVNGDGWSDMVYGASLASENTLDSGSATLLTYGCPPDAVYNYCAAVSNSTNQRARMGWQNTTSVTNNNFRLFANKCPANKPGLFYYGKLAVELPAGEGHLCVAGSVQRLTVVNTGTTGTPSHTVDFNNPPSPSGQISAGDTWFFSFWFRDPTGGPAGFNFADGLRATFCP